MSSLSDVVYWSSTGKVLHKDPDCPPFVRARVRAIMAMQRGDYAHAPVINSFDFENDTSPPAPYPPEHMALCRRCA